ncbi:MAG TPA: dihydroneopterin aldolase [Rhodopila sp.]|nr:dihydroneopterin aldolase [Rhodopila sp.]
MTTTLPFADEEGPLRHVFLRDLVLLASVGIYPHEHVNRQRVRVNVCLAVTDETARAGQMVGADELPRVVDYEKLANKVREVVTTGHTKLLETLAERIADVSLADQRVRLTRVRVEKLDLFTDIQALGVEIERRQGEWPAAK